MKELKKIVEHNLDGSIWLEYYLNDKGHLHGPYKFWFDNGKISIHYNFFNGKRHGIRKNWHYNGKLLYIKQQKNDVDCGIMIDFKY